jgi:oligoendopeptidase F
MFDLEKIRSDVENFCSDMNKEYYLNEAGLKDELNVSAIYEKYPHLFDKKLILQLATKRKQAQGEEERKLRYLQAFSLEYHLGMVVRTLTDKAQTMQSKGIIRVDGEKLAFRLAQIKMLNEPNREKREKLFGARNKFIDKVNVPLLERMQQLHDTAKEFEYENYTALFTDIKEIDFKTLANIMQNFIDKTETIYTKRMNEELKSKLGVQLEEAEKHDVSFFFRAKEFDEYFPKEKVLVTLKRTLANMGIRLEKQKNVHVDIEERPKKSPRAFCAPVRMPEDIKLVMMPQGGHDDYAALFHEAGHAEHFAFVKPNLPIEYKWLGDNSVSESYAFLLEYLLMDENWLEQNIKVSVAQEYLRFIALYKLLFLRSYGVKLTYEIRLHLDSLKGMDDVYKRIHEKVLKYRHPANHYLITVDDAFYSAQYLQAWIFEAQLRRFLQKEYGDEWFTSHEAGKHLVKMWAEGQKYNVVELAKTLGYKGLNIEPLTESVVRQLH